MICIVGFNLSKQSKSEMWSGAIVSRGAEGDRRVGTK